MIYTNFLKNTKNRVVTEKKGIFTVIEYQKDLSTTPEAAAREYFAAEMNVKKRQLVAELNNNSMIIQAGAMQWFGGDVNVKTDVRGAGDFIKKLAGASVTKETAIKPKYEGTGLVVLEPTYKFLLLEDLKSWGNSLVIEDGLFLACDSNIQIKTVMRTTVSSAVLGNEGLFNSELHGTGIVALESPVPREELVLIQLDNDVLKIDGSFAIAWSNTLKFTVERTTKTLIGSAASGEGFVNVYRGTGKVLLAPVR